MRAPGSNIRQARPPMGRCIRTPVVSTTTNAPSSTSTLPFSTKAMDARSFRGIGFGGGSPGSPFMDFSQSCGSAEPHRLQPDISAPVGPLATNTLHQCLLEYRWVRDRQDTFQYCVRDYTLSEARLRSRYTAMRAGHFQ